MKLYIDVVINAVESDEFVSGIFMDLSRGVNSIKHITLLKKCQCHQLAYNANHINNRTQFVEITHSTKDNRVVKIQATLQPVKFRALKDPF